MTDQSWFENVHLTEKKVAQNKTKHSRKEGKIKKKKTDGKIKR